MADGLKYHVASSIGTNDAVKADGSKFQMGIAVDLVNRKYEFGQVIKYSIAADEMGVSSTVVNAHQYGLSHTAQDANSCPSQFIQYGDHAVLGPSTVTGQEGYSEPIRVAGSGHLNDVDVNSWTNGLIYALDRQSKYQYQLSDSVSIYGTGRAAGWYIENMQAQTTGIQKGYISLNHMGRLIYDESAANSLTEIWESQLGTDFLGVNFAMPTSWSNANDNQVMGYSSGPLHANAKGPSRYFAKFGLMPIRHASFGAPFNSSSNYSNFDYYNDDASSSANDIKGVFRYVHQHSSGSHAQFAYTANQDPASKAGTSDRTLLGAMTGFDHPGGQYKDTAQAVFTSTNGLSTLVSSNYKQVGVFYQPLTRSVADSADGRFSKLTGGTNYRLGITYRGNMTSNGSIQNSSYSYAFFQWSPGIRGASDGDTNTYTDYYMSTDKLLDGSNSQLKTINSYTTKMVYGFVESPNIDLSDGVNYQAVGTVSYNQTHENSISSRFAGVEQMLFIDNMWLEHEGNISGATGKGYIEIDDFPEAGTLKVDRFRTNKPVVVRLSDGSRKTLDNTGTNQKFLHEITCEFLYLKQTEYDKLQDLIRWQDLGHKLTLHPHLPQVPHCLVGELELSNVRKSFWDLTRFSVSFKFTETD
tara:strand:+ start:2599 stop:4518 length:1920 start_codon:yes stop_codon:yes gene_type:complete